MRREEREVVRGLLKRVPGVAQDNESEGSAASADGRSRRRSRNAEREPFVGGVLLHAMLYCGAALLLTWLLLAVLPAPSATPFSGQGLEGATLSGWLAAGFTLLLALTGLLAPDAGIPLTASAKAGAGLRRFGALAGGAGYDGRYTHSAIGLMAAVGCSLPLLFCGPPFNGAALAVALAGGYALHLAIDAALVALLSVFSGPSRRESVRDASGPVFTVPFGRSPARNGHLLYPAFALGSLPLPSRASTSANEGGSGDGSGASGVKAEPAASATSSSAAPDTSVKTGKKPKRASGSGTASKKKGPPLKKKRPSKSRSSRSSGSSTSSTPGKRRADGEDG